MPMEKHRQLGMLRGPSATLFALPRLSRTISSVPVTAPPSPSQSPAVGSLRAKMESWVEAHEDFIGIKAVKEAQAGVMMQFIASFQWEKKLSVAQIDRRNKQLEIKSLQSRLKEIHSELDRTSRGEDRYLQLLTEEHALIKEERGLLEQFEMVSKNQDQRQSNSKMKKQIQHNRKLQVSTTFSGPQTNYMLGSGFYTFTMEGGRAIVLRRSRRIMQKDPVDYTVFFRRIIKRKPRYQKIRVMKRTTRQSIPIGPQDEDFEGTPRTNESNFFHGPLCRCAGPSQQQPESFVVSQPRPAQVVNVKDTKNRGRGRPKKRRALWNAQPVKRRRMPKMESPALCLDGDPNIQSDAALSRRAMLPRRSSFEIVEEGEDDMNIFMENNNATSNVPVEKVPVLVRHTTTMQEIVPEGENGAQDVGGNHSSPSIPANNPILELDNIADPNDDAPRPPSSLQSISEEVLEAIRMEEESGLSQPTEHPTGSQGPGWNTTNALKVYRFTRLRRDTEPTSQSTTDAESEQGTSTQDQASVPAKKSKKSKKKSKK